MKRSSVLLGVSVATALGLAAACSSSEPGAPSCITGGMGPGGQGGVGQGGSEAGTGHGGGHGTKVIGQHCTLHSDCADGLCLSEEQTGWGAGYCSRLCNSVVPCPDGTECVSAGNLGMVCLKQCDPAGDDCLSAQGCVDGVCVGGCATDDDCQNMGHCDPDYLVCYCAADADCPTLGNCEPDGFCYAPELCDDGTDGDGDGLRDCEDAEDCATACAVETTAACQAAVAAQPSNAGDTTGGSSLFAGSCTGGSGAKEQIYSYSPSAADALVHVWLDSATDQGIYLRSVCADASLTAELACQEGAPEARTEHLLYQASSPDPFYLFVDGTSWYADQDPAGPFLLGVREVATHAEVEPNDTRLQANAETPATLVSAAIGAGDNDWYSVAVPANATLWVAVLGSGLDTCAYGTIDSELQILAPDGTTELAHDDDNGTFDYCSTASAADLAAGTYFLRVSAAAKAAPGTTFGYGLVIEAQ
jgi:hypothetical protein